MIRYLERNQIDDTRWNSLIDGSTNGLVYAKTYFLDRFSPGWSALVSGESDTVMPLTFRRKYGISYLYQPSYLQQLGLFGKVNKAVLEDFLAAARNRFRFAEIHLNFSNMDPDMDPDAIPRKNYILPLNGPYETIAEGYSSIHAKNLRRAANVGLSYISSNDYGGNVKLNYSLYGEKTPSVGRSDYDAIVDLSVAVPRHLICREVRKDGVLQASCICFIDARRIYFVMSSVTEAAKPNQANHYLIDHLIREFSGRDLTLDFEGSELPGVEEFYKGFGAINQPYYFLKWNDLPWPLKWLKK